jgi:hypothetical protein
VLVTQLCEGQRVTVLQLPVTHAPIEHKHQTPTAPVVERTPIG